MDFECSPSAVQVQSKCSPSAVHLTICDILVNRCDLTLKMLVKKLKYTDVFFTRGIVHQHSKRRGGRRERGKEGGLWPVPRIKLNKFYVRAA